MERIGRLRLGTLALLAVAAMPGCGGVSQGDASQGTAGGGASNAGPQADRVGSVALELIAVRGITLGSVHYVVTTSGGSVLSEGDLPTPGTARAFPFDMPLAAGTGYTIALSGSPSSGADLTCAASFAGFDVTANNTTGITLYLACQDAADGTPVRPMDIMEECPRLLCDYLLVAPTLLELEGSAAVAMKAHDLDGKPVTYSWMVDEPSVGTFAPTTGSSAAFTCHNVKSGASLSAVASNGECIQVISRTVRCSDPGSP
jgi:hypothetical protein